MRAELSDLKSLPVLSAERVTLRPLAMPDAPILHSFFSDPETMRYWSSLPHPDESHTRALVASTGSGFESRTILQWGIARNDDSRLLGTVTLMPELNQPRAELGYVLGREHWGKGYAGEAQRRVVEFGFGDLALHRLEADTHPGNEASARSLERLGFRREGVLRERWIVDGERSDSVIWGLLAGEWAAGSGAHAHGA